MKTTILILATLLAFADKHWHAVVNLACQFGIGLCAEEWAGASVWI